MALIRPPRAAIFSNLALAEEGRRRHGGLGGRGSHVTFEDATGTWLAFYRAILPIRHSLVLDPFSRATANLAVVVEEANERFAKRFASTPVVRTPQAELGWHARSNALRRDIEGELTGALEAAEATRPRLAALLAECEQLHTEFVGRR